MEAEAILGEALNRSYHHVEVNLGDGSIDLNKILIDSQSIADHNLAAAEALDTWGDTDTIMGVENVRGTSSADILLEVSREYLDKHMGGTLLPEGRCGWQRVVEWSGVWSCVVLKRKKSKW